MARNEQRILGFTVAILILALAVGLLGWADRQSQSDRAKLQARVGQLEGQLRENGIEPAAPPAKTPVVRRSPPLTTATTTRRAPTTAQAPAPTTTTSTTVRPVPPQPPPSTTTTSPAPPPSPPCTTLPAPIARCVP